MKIRERLIIAFLIIITIPVILIGAVGGAIVKHQMNALQQSYDVETNTLQILINPLQVFNRLTQGVYNIIQTQTKKDPDRFLNTAYLDSINSDLDSKFSYLVVEKEDEYQYIGNKYKFNPILDYMPGFGSDSSNVDGGFYINGKHASLIKQQDFLFTDGSRGSVFIVTAIDTILPQLQSSAIQFIASFILIICFTAIILVLWIYQGIIRPLNALRLATVQMRDGNLDCPVRAESSDEIGELCEDFEKMRVRLKELIDSRLQYEEASRELISNISHDLKTPLTAIKGYSEGIMDGVADTPEKMDRYLKTICTKANAMSVLVDELSFYSKIDTNSIPYNFMAINVNHFFNDCINELTLDLEVKNIDLGYFNFVDKSQEIWADAEQLKRVINNIIGNSAKYIDKAKGIINVRIQDAGDFIQISIEDNGKGIDEEDETLIFDRFYRTDASRNSLQGGTGLGLAISKKIIEDHGGKIWATGKLDVGTTIYFTLVKRNDAVIEPEKVSPTKNRKDKTKHE
ncbi:MAG: HAMP domain-containing sensor histidine kinase [Acetivibrio sp.]